MSDTQVVLSHEVGEIPAIPLLSDTPKLSPRTVTTPPPVAGLFVGCANERAGVSKENCCRPVPTMALRVNRADCSIPAPGGARHVDAVLDVQLNVAQPVSPILAEGVKSSVPKFTPDTVTLPPLLAAEFITDSRVMIGES